MSELLANLKASPEFQAMIREYVRNAPKVRPFDPSKPPEAQTFAYAFHSGMDKGIRAFAAYLTGVQQENEQ